MATTHDSFDASSHGAFLASAHGWRNSPQILSPNLWKFDGSTGEILGAYRIGDTLNALDVDGGSVYVGGSISGDKNLWCANTSGVTQWSDLTHATAAVQYVRARPGYVAATDGAEVHKYNSSGSKQWSSSGSLGGSVVEMSTVGYVFTNSEFKLKAINGHDGSLAWVFQPNFLSGVWQTFNVANIAAASDDTAAVIGVSSSKLGRWFMNADGTLFKRRGFSAGDLYNPVAPAPGYVGVYQSIGNDGQGIRHSIQTGWISNPGPVYDIVNSRIDWGVSAGTWPDNTACNALDFVFDRYQAIVAQSRFGWGADLPALASGSNAIIPMRGGIGKTWGAWSGNGAYGAGMYDPVTGSPEIYWDGPSPHADNGQAAKRIAMDEDGNVWTI